MKYGNQFVEICQLEPLQLIRDVAHRAVLVRGGVDALTPWACPRFCEGSTNLAKDGCAEGTIFEKDLMV